MTPEQVSKLVRLGLLVVAYLIVGAWSLGVGLDMVNKPSDAFFFGGWALILGTLGVGSQVAICVYKNMRIF